MAVWKREQRAGIELIVLLYIGEIKIVIAWKSQEGRVDQLFQLDWALCAGEGMVRRQNR